MCIATQFELSQEVCGMQASRQWERLHSMRTVTLSSCCSKLKQTSQAHHVFYQSPDRLV